MLETKTNSISLSSGEVKVYTLSSPEKESADTIPILIIPGWGESAKVAMTLAEDLHISGRKVYVIEYGKLNNPKKVAGCGIDDSWPVTERARACAVIEFLSLQNEKIHIVAHSQGAVSAMLSASIAKENIGEIILITPAGIVLLNLKHLVFRFIKSFFVQLKNAFQTGDSRGKLYFSQVSQYIGGNPLQLGRDAYGLANLDILPLVTEACSDGRSVHVLCSQNDILFPANAIKERVGSICPVYDVEGNHDSLYIDAQTVVKHIQAILNKLHA